MVTLKIDRKTIQVKAGTTILEAARKAGFGIPTLCYLEGINEIGACRVCVVELKGAEQLVTACNTAVQEGMEVLTSSPRVRHARRAAVELMLTEHDCNCPTCVRNGNCKLQTLANSLGVRNVRLKNRIPTQRVDDSSPSIVRDPKKCVMCYRCVSFCDKVQSLGVWRISGTGARTSIEPAFGKPLATTDCAYCGQCVTHCPVGALYEKSDKDKVWDLLSDPEKVTIVQVAPAVRASWGEELGISREVATPERLVATLRHLGFDHIFDTCFTADLTIMEEGTELLGRIGSKDAKMPMFTSCCPGWVRFVKTQYPELVEHLSSAKSPQQMFGAVAKTYFAKKLDVDPSRIFSISIMPCTAKKYECEVPEVNDSGAGQDVDVVLTTRELTRLLRSCHIDPETLEDEPFDSPMGLGTGAGVIFGTTGGVMEAALRSAYFLLTGTNPDPDAFSGVRGRDGWREASFDIQGSEVKVAVASGLANARKLVEAIRKGEVDYDFVEIMACPGGCAGGGGQPIEDGKELAGHRSETLYEIDANSRMRFSHENNSVVQIYDEFFKNPLSDMSHELLHTKHNTWTLDT